MKRLSVLIIGAGGHGQVVAEILLQMAIENSALAPIGYLDDDVSLADMMLLGLPVLGPVTSLGKIAHDAVALGIGDNGVRQRLYNTMVSSGEHFVAAVHPSAFIGIGVDVPPSVAVCAGAIVSPGVSLGVNVLINTGASVDHHCQIAGHVHIAPGARLGGEVHVGVGSLVGIGATVLPQLRIGMNAIVGAGAVVTRNVPDYAVVTGIPARVTRITTDSFRA